MYGVPDIATGSIADTPYTYSWELKDVAQVLVYGRAWPADNVIEFAFEFATGRWAGIGIHTDGPMTNGDFWICDGLLETHYDANLIGATSNGRPDLDAVDNILPVNGSSFFTDNGRTTCRLRRNIDTGDAEDNIVLDEQADHVIAQGAIQTVGFFNYDALVGHNAGPERKRVNLNLISASPALSAPSAMVAALALIAAVVAMF